MEKIKTEIEKYKKNNTVLGSVYFDKKNNVYTYQYKDFNNKIKKVSSRNLSLLDIKIKKIDKEIKHFYNFNKNKNDLFNISFIDLLYLLEIEKYKKNLITESTLNRNIFTIKKIEQYKAFNQNINKITLNDINELNYNIVTFSNSTIKKIFVILKNGFNFSFANGLINKNILNNYKIAKSIKSDKKVKALNNKELSDLLTKGKKSKFYDLYKFMIYTGVRVGEALALSYNDIDFINDTITISKTISKNIKGNTYIKQGGKTENANRVIPLLNNTKTLLTELKKKNNNAANDIIFDFFNGKNINIYVINNDLKKYVKKDDITTHNLRHTFTTKCIEFRSITIIFE